MGYVRLSLEGAGGGKGKLERGKICLVDVDVDVG